MAKVSDWEREVRKLSDLDLMSKAQALDSLISWEFFEVQFEGYGLKSIRAIIDAEILARGLGETIVSPAPEVPGNRSCENCSKRYKDYDLERFVCREYDSPADVPVVCSAHEFIGGD